MRWSEAVTLEFVKIYLRHECLWNPSYPGYKLKYRREKAYRSICAEFKQATNKALTLLEVKIKIKNLRTTYAQQVHKILEKSNPDTIYEPSLIWFNEMDRCLKNVSTNRSAPAYNVTSNQDTPEVDSSSQVWVDQQIPISGEEIHPDPLIPNTDEEIETSKSEDTSHITKNDHKPPAPHKKLKKKKSKYRHSNHIFYADSNLDSVTRDLKQTKEDEFDIYGKYVASQLRKINLHKALRLQLEIQSLLSEARILDLE